MGAVRIPSLEHHRESLGLGSYLKNNGGLLKCMVFSLFDFHEPINHLMQFLSMLKKIIPRAARHHSLCNGYSLH